MPAAVDTRHQFPLPPTLSPPVVIQQLHTHDALILHNPIIEGFERLPHADVTQVAADPFFAPAAAQDGDREQQQPSVAYTWRERMPVIALLGLTMVVTPNAYFQNTPGGVRVRVDAAGGTRIRAVYAMEEEKEEDRPGSHGSGSVCWVLRETAQIECNVLLKPFIVGNFEALHQHLGQRILDYIAGVALESEDK